LNFVFLSPVRRGTQKNLKGHAPRAAHYGQHAGLYALPRRAAVGARIGSSFILISGYIVERNLFRWNAGNGMNSVLPAQPQRSAASSQCS
jgi:hypothetical protein